eukprot:GHVT01101003.1.p1 GENE.GHVT01101003.1~~GHVT01101003.1.p1  ORF type:complete len:408 (+),score=126.01 GHVT01101003.1:551-1774(+)
MHTSPRLLVVGQEPVRGRLLCIDYGYSFVGLALGTANTFKTNRKAIEQRQLENPPGLPNENNRQDSDDGVPVTTPSAFSASPPSPFPSPFPSSSSPPSSFSASSSSSPSSFSSCDYFREQSLAALSPLGVVSFDGRVRRLSDLLAELVAVLRVDAVVVGKPTPRCPHRRISTPGAGRFSSSSGREKHAPPCKKCDVACRPVSFRDFAATLCAAMVERQRDRTRGKQIIKGGAAMAAPAAASPSVSMSACGDVRPCAAVHPYALPDRVYFFPEAFSTKAAQAACSRGWQQQQQQERPSGVDPSVLPGASLGSGASSSLGRASAAATARRSASRLLKTIFAGDAVPPSVRRKDALAAVATLADFIEQKGQFAEVIAPSNRTLFPIASETRCAQGYMELIDPRRRNTQPK